MKVLYWILLPLVPFIASAATDCESEKVQFFCEFEPHCVWRYKRCSFSPEPNTRTLFIGNSFTIRNDLPLMVRRIARRAGLNPHVNTVTQGSTTLSDHLPRAVNFIQRRNNWKAVVVQEQSVMVSLPFYRSITLPAARTLFRASIDRAETFVLFETWGYRWGNPSFVTGLKDDYDSMQDRLTQGFEDILQTLVENVQPSHNGTHNGTRVEIAPVGQAWKRAKTQSERLFASLYDADGRHPSIKGTYLSACVLYAVIYKRSPVGNRYIPQGVSRRDARTLQRVAYNTVRPL